MDDEQLSLLPLDSLNGRSIWLAFALWTLPRYSRCTDSLIHFFNLGALHVRCLLRLMAVHFFDLVNVLMELKVSIKDGYLHALLLLRRLDTNFQVFREIFFNWYIYICL